MTKSRRKSHSKSRCKSHCCYCCGATSNLSDHHIIPLREGGRDALTNVVTLCDEHHNEVEGPSDGAWDRVCKLKEAIRCGRISKSGAERAEAKRAEKAYEAMLENRKKQQLRNLGVVLEEDKPPVNLGAKELTALRRKMGYWPDLNGVKYGTHAKHLVLIGQAAYARRLWDEAPAEFWESIEGRVDDRADDRMAA
jgi:hypothetical protein